MGGTVIDVGYWMLVLSGVEALDKERALRSFSSIQYPKSNIQYRFYIAPGPIEKIPFRR
jgi:hypothetical protein